MPKFIQDPIVDAYLEMLSSSSKKYSDVPDIDYVLEHDGESLVEAEKNLLLECRAESESIERYLNELVIPQIHNKISKLPKEYAPSVKKYVSSCILKSLETL